MYVVSIHQNEEFIPLVYMYLQVSLQDRHVIVSVMKCKADCSLTCVMSYFAVYDVFFAFFLLLRY